MDEFSMDFFDLNSTMTCMALPLKTNSHGLTASFSENTHFLTYSLPLFELQIGIILILSHLIHFLLKPFGISTFVSCILAGIILGPNGLGKFDFTREVIFPHDSQGLIFTIINLGYYIYVFLAAVKMEIGMVFKTGRKALTIAITMTLVPYLVDMIYNHVRHEGRPGALTLEDNTAISIGVITSLPVVANVIDHLKLANTKIGRLALATGLVADISGLFLFLIRLFQDTKSLANVFRFLLPTLLFFLSLAFIFRPAVNWVIRRTPEGKPLNTNFIYVIMMIVIYSQTFFTRIGQTLVSAPFIIGLATPTGVPLGSILVEKYESFVSGVTMPLLIATAFMRADFYVFITNLVNIKQTMIALFTGLLLKMVGCMIPSMMFKMPINEAATLAFILNHMGFVQVRKCASNRDSGTFREQVFCLLALYILFNATVIPVIIRKIYNPFEKYDVNFTRNVVSMKPHTELKIITCIYGKDNTNSYIKLLDTINPTKQNPIGIYALHLVELVGRYVPIFISHSKYKPISTTTSQKVIHEFNQFEQNNWDSVSVQLFTSHSSFPLMHQDVINTALEKKASLIILPLHQRWSVHGYMESQDKGWRNVNHNVLEKAPCSVAIFFSRRTIVRQRSITNFAPYLSVCMIFFGGNDDREALTLAKRMIKDQSEVALTIVHFIWQEYDQHEIDDLDDHVYDSVVIDDIRQMSNARIDYRPYVVQDGSDTIMKVRSMADQFDLFVLGRRHGLPTPQISGLSEWIELPELGVIGDFFASKELDTNASVLVVQQQKQIVRKL